MSIDDLDKRIIARLQGDIPLVSRPFAPMARELGISEAEVVERIRRMADEKVMRRFGATLRHQKSGFSVNVMVAWRVPEERVREVGDKLASFRQVTHCYQRDLCGDFPYNVYSMVHGKSAEEVQALVEKMSAAVGLKDYALLFSRQELKKTSMKYFKP